MSKVFEAMRRVSRMCHQGDCYGYTDNGTIEWLLTHGYYVESVLFNPQRSEGPFIIDIAQKPPLSQHYFGYGMTYAGAVLNAADAIARDREAEARA